MVTDIQLTWLAQIWRIVIIVNCNTYSVKCCNDISYLLQPVDGVAEVWDKSVQFFEVYDENGTYLTHHCHYNSLIIYLVAVMHFGFEISKTIMNKNKNDKTY